MAKSEHEHHNAEHGHEHKWDEKAETKEAERRVKLGLILAEWGNKNKVEVTRDDLQQAIWAEASRYPDPKQVFEFYNKTPVEKRLHEKVIMGEASPLPEFLIPSHHAIMGYDGTPRVLNPNTNEIKILEPLH
jgi:FKBP-type peptidyl-prolyl cis-trans isomerase (trigger factor)